MEGEIVNLLSVGGHFSTTAERTKGQWEESRDCLRVIVSSTSGVAYIQCIHALCITVYCIIPVYIHVHVDELDNSNKVTHPLHVMVCLMSHSKFLTTGDNGPCKTVQ